MEAYNNIMVGWLVGLCYLMTPGLSEVIQSDIQYDNTFSKLANHQTRLTLTHKVGCQPGDFMWSL